MLPNGTCFIIGAGSGFDIKMPLGSELLKMIEKQSEFRSHQGRIVEVPESLFHAMFWEPVPENQTRIRQRADIKQIYDVNARISKAASLIGSIDDYVNLHSNDAQLVRAAKIQIAYSILSSEKRCSLMPKQEYDVYTDLRNISNSWMFDFFRMISKPSISTDPARLFTNVSVINFNYDRCLEQFLISAIPNLYGISSDDTLDLVRNATIIHPYGQIGDLPSISLSSNAVKFGDNTQHSSVLRASELIKTYTEQVNSNVSQQIKNIVHTSSQIVFLGFGYHKQNIDLLGGISTGSNKAIFGTAIGESDANIIEYGVRLRGVGGIGVPGQRMPGNVHLRSDLDCSSLLRHYREVISS